MKGRGKPPGRGGGAGKGPQGRGPGAPRPPGKRPAGGSKPPRARSRAPADRDEPADERGRKTPRPATGRRRDDARPFGKPAPHRGEDRRSLERVRRVPQREPEFRSFDDAPRRGRDDDWDADDRGWSPEDDLDIAAIEEPRDEPRRDEPRRPAPTGPTRAELKAAATATLQTGVQTLTVTADEADMRVDRFLAARFPQLSFSYIQRIVRKGELRVNGRRVETKDRLEAGQAQHLDAVVVAFHHEQKIVDHRDAVGAFELSLAGPAAADIAQGAPIATVVDHELVRCLRRPDHPDRAVRRHPGGG